VSDRMSIRRTSDVSKSGVVDVMWTAACPCPAPPVASMTFRCIRSGPVYAWAARHLDTYHPKGKL
jgi:hypothetical protein